MPTSTNRTKWPITGGAVSVQPGWFPGHSLALFYINMGYGNEPLNMSHAMLPMFQIAGPSNTQYDGTFCLPQVPLPANFPLKIGDNATIQIVEAAQHGAALYNCADITFADPKDVPEVNSSNCFNSTEIKFNLVYSTAEESAAQSAVLFNSMSLLLPLVMMVASWIYL
ncbi:hypothetical protein P154DRAFT_519671 [Amniculicola lignicola CBS 123094]|uniref:Copper acquisition factor BIM1-like domain-containing protein n=1 Tax=Amniculicola lignicola CBS 123094 TaxID=1392246 RepID=A0A6A5WYF6_9PLEO|nr:hypothetical protein P154DRAFT_519671 [Amniculicola lignicola CBS 123094]